VNNRCESSHSSSSCGGKSTEGERTKGE
jgi:hypothetical protein